MNADWFAPKICVHLRLIISESSSSIATQDLLATDESHFQDSLTERVLSAVFEVSNTLGAGFLEKVYERALLTELNLRGIRATGQVSLSVTYKGHYVGDYVADILVEDVLVVELKCADRLTNGHIAQCLNYLRASGRTICLLVNFRKPKVEWKRIVYRHEMPGQRDTPAGPPHQFSVL